MFTAFVWAQAELFAFLVKLAAGYLYRWFNDQKGSRVTHESGCPSSDPPLTRDNTP